MINTINLKGQLHIFESTGNRFLVFDDKKNIYNTSKKNNLRLHKTIQHKLTVDMYRYKADSVLILHKTPDHDDSFVILERDGTQSIFCGNGLRALALLRSQKNNRKKNIFIVGKNEYVVQRIHSNFFQSSVGNVNIDPKKMHHYLTKKIYSLAYNQIIKKLNKLFIKNKKIKIITLADIGKEPHLIIKIPANYDVFSKKNRALAHFIMQTKTVFPIGINLDFVKTITPGLKKIWLDTFERGVNDFTDSCGSGAICSVFAMLYTTNRLNATAKIEVITMGGVLNIEVDPTNHYYISGSVKHLASL